MGFCKFSFTCKTRATHTPHRNSELSQWRNYKLRCRRVRSPTVRSRNYHPLNSICGVVFVADCVFEPRSGQPKDYKIGICCFSTKWAALTKKSKDGFARSHDNVSEWSNISTRGLFFRWVCTINLSTTTCKCIGLVQRGHHLIECILFSPWSMYSWKVALLMLENNHSLTQHREVCCFYVFHSTIEKSSSRGKCYLYLTMLNSHLLVWKKIIP
jgi:hypothetical protein